MDVGLIFNEVTKKYEADYPSTGAVNPLVTETGPATLTNKTLASASTTGQVLLADGTVGVPALAFTSDVDNGLYKGGENTLSASGAFQVATTLTVNGNVVATTSKTQLYSAVTTLTGATDAIDISLGDIFMLSTAAGVNAATLAAPVAGDNGRIIKIFSGTAFAHTITVAGGIGGAGATDDVVTFTNRKAAAITLYAHAANWHMVGSYLAAIA